MKENQSSRMLNLYLLCVLGFCLYGVSDAEEYNSTQVHFVKLIMEESAIPNVTDVLLNKDFGFDNYTLNSLTKTTECNPVSNTCVCGEGFEWSTDVCSSEAKCCGTEVCESTKFTCISNNTVTLSGSLTLASQHYHRCLDDPTTENFKDCNENLTTTMKTFYSQIHGFDKLTVTKYRVGSVIVEFDVVVSSNVALPDLERTSKSLTAKLEAYLNLETEGIVSLEVPQELLAFGTDPVTLSCSLKTDQELSPHWELKNYLNETKDIHDGTESAISLAPQVTSNLKLNVLSLLWTGRYTCSYEQDHGKVKISHKASADLDICAEAKIRISTSPGFPHCFDDEDLVSVTVNCEVDQTYERYEDVWEKQDINAQLMKIKPENTLGMTVFSARTFVSCKSTNPTVTCKLTNRCNQMATAKVKIILIKVGDAFCQAEGDWMDTKEERTAVIKCRDSVGTRERPCNKNETWGSETSFCVNRELSDVLSKAVICDIGQGTVQKNAGQVFTEFQSVTNNTREINSPANLNASVNVIKTMKSKPEITSYDEITVDHFLRSSSNLMNPSLNSSWTTAGEQNNSKHLAEDYLSSVEQMINEVDIKRQSKNTNLEVASCNQTQAAHCRSRVFNNNVTLDSPGATSIKTAGFLHLESYLPNKDHESIPNSNVISATRQSANKEDRVKIRIDFELLRSRPRNTEIKCVFWSNETHEWSRAGCELVDSEGSCECDHLSAFAILMSKAPLEVPCLSEFTYFGLSVSIVSLLICLAVELILWRDVVKTDTLHLRHCAHVNISICLLIGDVCFLASSLPGDLPEIWCKTLVVVEHFCFLAMFFWMLCLSSILLHKTVYLSLHGISKTAYLRYSIIVGYVCPLLIVVITFLANNGEEGRYYSKETRWLVYNGTLKGSIFTFILPVGIIVFVNVFFMCLVIMRLLQPIKAAQRVTIKEKNSAKTVIRSVILLTPVFGLTWGFGFLVIIVDLTSGPAAYAVNYIFTIMNAFQGLYIFLTTCVGDRMVRDGLRRYFWKKVSSVSTISTSVSSVDQSCKDDDKIKK